MSIFRLKYSRPAILDSVYRYILKSFYSTLKCRYCFKTKYGWLKTRLDSAGIFYYFI